MKISFWVCVLRLTLTNIFDMKVDFQYDVDSSILRTSGNELITESIFDFNGSDAEKVFFEEICPKIFGPYYYQFVLPQVNIESLIDGNEFLNARVDFLLTTPQKKLVVEIDGKEHIEHGERDNKRDELLKSKGFDVIRIKNHEILNDYEDTVKEIEVILENEKYYFSKDISRTEKVMVSTKIAHQLFIALTELGYYGFANESGEIEFNVNLQASSLDEAEKVQLLKVVEEKFNEFIGKICKLYDMDILYSVALEPYKTKKYKYTLVVGSMSRIDDAAAYINDIAFPKKLQQSVKIQRARRIESPNKEILEYFLQYIFHKDHFWEGQFEAISRAVSGSDAIVLLPTGSGKSIAFQLASLLMPGLAIVVDPIIALINDQIDNLRLNGIDRTVGITSQQSRQQKEKLLKQFGRGSFLFTYIAPERLQTKEFRNSLREVTVTQPISLIVIDEAHCVSEWGHDFRTSYLNIGRVCRDYCSSENRTPPLLALTGTASNSVLRDVQRELQINEYDAIITPKTFDRAELNFFVKSTPSINKKQVLKGLLNQFLPNQFGMTNNSFYDTRGESTASGLIFCPHVNGEFGVKNLSDFIGSDLHISNNIYAGKTPKGFMRNSWDDYKNNVAKKFKLNEFPLLIATKSFGMGIDKPNIRYTMHYGLPNSIESFYQEAGRAGRDKKKSTCLLLVSNDNPNRTNKLLDINSSTEEIQYIMDNERSFETDDDITRAMYFHTNAFRGSCRN